MLAHVDYLDEAIQGASVQIEALMVPFAAEIERLDTIPGVNRRTAEVLIAETGADMSRFPTAKHLASWAGLCPGNNESAGKRMAATVRKGNRWLRTALVLPQKVHDSGAPPAAASRSSSESPRIAISSPGSRPQRKPRARPEPAWPAGRPRRVECPTVPRSTWTKALGEQVFGLPPMDNRNPRLDRGNLDFIRRHWVALNYIYELPFGTGKRFGNSLSGAADKIVGGWQLAGLASFGTGQPYSVTFTSRTLGWPSNRADIVGDPDPADRSIDRWFDPAAFAVPAPFTYGNSVRNMLFGPAFFNWDAALFKHTPINDRFTLEFRAEFFNILNHPSFGLPAADVTTPATVGRITSTANEPRNIQFGVRLSF